MTKKVKINKIIVTPYGEGVSLQALAKDNQNVYLTPEDLRAIADFLQAR